MVIFDETAGDDAEDALVPFAGLDDDGIVTDAALFDFVDGKILFRFSFFVQLL